MTVKTLAVPCPTCKKQVLMTKDYPYRPFCSKRCKDSDFGDWAAAENRIPGKDLNDELWAEEIDWED